MNQEFKPPAIGGSVRSRAQAITENIIANDYNVANLSADKGLGSVPKVRYKDQAPNLPAANWNMADAASHRSVLETAISIGKRTRAETKGVGDGLDILQRNLRNGNQVDLIEASKRRSIKVW